MVGTIANDYNLEQISRIQVGKQADVLVLFFLLEELFSPEVKKKNFFYYEERTLHDSSLSRSTHSVLAADLGLDDMAYTFFEGAARTDLGPVMTTSDAGIHAASMGGIWQCVVYGFGGVRIVGDKLRSGTPSAEKLAGAALPPALAGTGVPRHRTAGRREAGDRIRRDRSPGSLWHRSGAGLLRN